ncbi:M20/M25/M40 family metallo-hydrolase, partial [Pseudomonas syringae]
VTGATYASASDEALRDLVAIPTARVDGVAQHENPEFIKFADKIKSLAQSFNLDFRNIDNRVYEISLQGAGNEVVGIHAHADVVPVTPENWVLEDGTRLNPFKVTQIGDRMYRRGTAHAKNGIVVALYAVTTHTGEQRPLARNRQVLHGTTAATPGHALPHSLARTPTPQY